MSPRAPRGASRRRRASPSDEDEDERISKVERILNLLALLLSSPHPVSAEVIHETVTGYREQIGEPETTFVKRFGRDQAELRRIGVPIHHVPRDSHGEGGYVVRREDYFLPRLQLEPMESLLLDQLAATVDADPEGHYSQALRAAIRKLHFDRAGPEEDPRDGLGTALAPALTPPASERDLCLILGAAVGLRQRVRLSYYSIARDVESRREVDPYGLRFVGGHWYLVGRDHRRDQLRTFRLSRIKGDPEVLPPTAAFSVPADFSLEAHVPKGPWGFGGSGPSEVTVRFDPEVDWIVRRETQGEHGVRAEVDAADAAATSGAPTDHAGARAPIRFAGGHLPALLRYLARYLDHVEVVQPPDARAAFHDLAAQARARYCEVPAAEGSAE